MVKYFASASFFIKGMAALSLVIVSAQYAVAAPLSAVMTYESMTITAEGVKKQTQFQEKFIRDANVVWSERIIGKTAQQHAHESEEDNEHNLNFATAAKWLVKDEKI